MKQSITVFCRVKPVSSTKEGNYEVTSAESGEEKLEVQGKCWSIWLNSIFENIVNSCKVPRLDSEGSVNNKRELHRFKFAHVFQKSTYQDQVFNRVAKGVIDNCLRGYNGTVFAYGQTGSGKTFTVTGGPENYADRGLIPRTLNYLFQQFRLEQKFH